MLKFFNGIDLDPEKGFSIKRASTNKWYPAMDLLKKTFDFLKGSSTCLTKASYMREYNEICTIYRFMGQKIPSGLKYQED